MWIDDLVTLLQAANVGTFGVNIFASTKSVIPNGAGPFLSIIETGGTSPDNTQNSAVPAYDRPGAQLVSRAATYVAARAMLKAALAAVIIENQFVNGIWYVKIRPNQSIFDAGQDNVERAQCKVNILGDKRPS
jgi:hypothetical protein